MTAAFFFRPETDDHDRRTVGIYTTDCWEIKLATLVELGPRVAVQVYPHHVLTPETSRLVRVILEWAEQFQDEGHGQERFGALWCSQPLEPSVATEIAHTPKALQVIEETRVFLSELPQDLGRGSLNGLKAQLAHRVDEVLR